MLTRIKNIFDTFYAEEKQKNPYSYDLYQKLSNKFFMMLLILYCNKMDTDILLNNEMERICSNELKNKEFYFLYQHVKNDIYYYPEYIDLYLNLKALACPKEELRKAVLFFYLAGQTNPRFSKEELSVNFAFDKMLYSLLQIKEGEHVLYPVFECTQLINLSSPCFLEVLNEVWSSNRFMNNFDDTLLKFLFQAEIINIQDTTVPFFWLPCHDMPKRADKVFCNIFQSSLSFENNTNYDTLRNYENLSYVDSNINELSINIWDYSLTALKDNGRAVFVLPESHGRIKVLSSLRRKLLEEDWIESLLYLPFGSILLVLDKNKKNQGSIFYKDLRQEKCSKDEIGELIEKNYYTDCEFFTEIMITDERIENSRFEFNISTLNKKILLTNTKQTELKDILSNDLIRGISKSQKTKQRKEENLQANAYLLSSANISSGRIVYGENDAVTVTKREILLYGIEKGDILISCRGAFYSTIVEKEYSDLLLVSDSLMIVRLDREKYNPYILLFLLQSKNYTEYVESLSTGGNMFVLNYDSANKIQLPYYSVSEADSIGLEIQNMYNNYYTKIEKAQHEFEKKKNEFCKVLSIE